jgi:hypothetical protein
MNGVAWRPVLLLAVLACACGKRPPAPTAPVASVEPAASPRVPFTIERVWHRKADEKAFGRLANAAGDLQVTATGLDHVTRKRTTSIAWKDVEVVSFGKMKGDVDTDWVVLAVRANGDRRLVGLRDGTRFGYGERTREIYEQIRGAARELGVAQFAIPEGLDVHEAFHRQLVFGIPAGWHATTRSIVVSEGEARFGRDLFTSEPIVRSRPTEPPELDDEALARANAGEIPALVLLRAEAGDAMRCERGIKPKVRDDVVALLKSDPLLGGVSGAWEMAPADVAPCRGLRLVARGEHDTAEAVAVARQGVLYVLGFRAPTAMADATREQFEKVVASVRLSVAL